MKVTDASTYRLLQTNMDRNQQKLQDLLLQSASGLKFNTASDDPSAIRPVLTARNQITLSDRFLNTLGVSADNMDSTDGILATVENIFQKADELNISSINGMLTPTDFTTLADEISEFKQELIGVGNTQIDGKYIFAGYSVETVPFVENPDYDPALYNEADRSTWPVLYQGDANRTTLEIGENEYLEVDLTGNEIFMGIENNEWKDGAQGLTGGTMYSTGITAPGGGDITITKDGKEPATIPASFLSDTDGNYAQKFSNLMQNTPLNMGDMAGLSEYNIADGDAYTLEVNGTSATIGGTTVFPFTLQGMADALGATNTPPLPAGTTSGTLDNGVQFDITTGSLQFTTVDGDDSVTLHEAVTNPTSNPAVKGFLPATTLDTGLKTEILPATANAGDLGGLTTDGYAAPDTYTLEIGSGTDTPITATLDGSTYSFDLAGMAAALGDTPGAVVDVAGKSGTLANGVSYDISSGSLVFTGVEGGENIELSETIPATKTNHIISPTGDITGYGSVDLTTDTTKNVSLSEPAGSNALSNAGLAAGTIEGSITIDLFSALTRLEESLRAGNIDDPDGPGGGLMQSISTLELASTQNQRKRSQLGVKAMRVDDSIISLQGALVDTKETLSRYEDADAAETFSALVQQQTAWEAALSVTGQVSQVTILDYI